MSNRKPPRLVGTARVDLPVVEASGSAVRQVDERVQVLRVGGWWLFAHEWRQGLSYGRSDERAGEAGQGGGGPKAGDTVTAGVGATWPNNKLLIAVLPPTIALLIAAFGFWESGNKDRAAAEEAEKARAAEVAKDQSAVERDQEIRLAGLLLVEYKELVDDVRTMQTSADACIDAIDLESADVGTSCNLTEQYYDALGAMDKALLVSSSESLKTTAGTVEQCFFDVWTESRDLLLGRSTNADQLNDSVNCINDSVVDLIDELEGIITLEAE